MFKNSSNYLISIMSCKALCSIANTLYIKHMQSLNRNGIGIVFKELRKQVNKNILSEKVGGI